MTIHFWEVFTAVLSAIILGTYFFLAVQNKLKKTKDSNVNFGSNFYPILVIACLGIMKVSGVL